MIREWSAFESEHGALGGIALCLCACTSCPSTAKRDHGMGLFDKLKGVFHPRNS
jgi:hypothetical protein